MADDILQGWDTNLPGFYGECTLETYGDNYVVTLVQRWQLDERGTAEILAATVRMEAENGKNAEWNTWDPRTIREINRDRREAGY